MRAAGPWNAWALATSVAVVAAAPPAPAQTSFDHDRPGATTLANGVLTETLIANNPPLLAISAATLGLGADDDIDALSYGDDTAMQFMHALSFSVDPGSAGAPGSGVASEIAADTPPGTTPGACGDVFVQLFLTNELAPPADGYDGVLGTDGDEIHALWKTPCPALPPTLSDDLDAFEYTAPFAGPGPLAGVYFSLQAGSPTLAVIGATAGDILYSDLTGVPPIIATLAGAGAATDVNLGIAGLDLDALNVVGMTGPPPTGGTISAGSVGQSIGPFAAPSSTHLVQYSVTAGAFLGADVLVRTSAGIATVHTPPGGLGLLVADQLDALEVLPTTHGAVPALSPGGLVLLALAIAGLGALRSRRARRC